MSRIHRVGRRHFLRGAGGFVLACPFLSSLSPRRARATPVRQKRLIALCTDHGGIHAPDLYPADDPGAASLPLHPAELNVPAHTGRWSSLTLSRRGLQSHLSEVLAAPSPELTAKLVGKMNVLTGFDVPTYMGHNRGGFLGNYAANDQGEDLHGSFMATIDQLVARAPSFNAVEPKERSLHFGLNYGVGSDLLTVASTSLASGIPTPVRADAHPRMLWERVFGQGSSAADDDLVVDKVYEHYRRVTSGAFGDARRLSSADFEKLEAHMDLLLELERKLEVSIACEARSAPATPETAREALRDAVDVIGAAIRCRASHVAVLTSETELFATGGSYQYWHNEVAHNGCGDVSSHKPEWQALAQQAQRTFFREAFLRLARALDVEEDEEGTYLDRSLLFWTMESGDKTHDGFALPVVTAGSAAGAFHTGRFIDYRNHAHRLLLTDDEPFRLPGLLYNRFTSNVLQAMGVATDSFHAEVERVAPVAFAEGARGYGLPWYHPDAFWTGRDLRRDVWPWSRFETADAPLPGWARGA